MSSLSLPVRGAWIEIVISIVVDYRLQSLPVRGAWIEIACLFTLYINFAVAPRAGSVD